MDVAKRALGALGRAAVPARPAAERRAEAFHRVVDEHLDEAYRLARAITRDAAEAEDATHDAFELAWRRWHTLRDPDRFEAWFRRILVNTCRNRVRRRSRFAVRDLSPDLTVVAAPANAADDRVLLRSGLAQLDPDDRALLALRYDADLTVEAIAEALGLPAGTVKSRLHRALRRLAHALADPIGEE